MHGTSILRGMQFRLAFIVLLQGWTLERRSQEGERDEMR